MDFFNGGCVYSLLHFLDPNPYYRVLRVVTSLVTGLVGFLFVFSSNETINFEPKIITFFFVCIIIAVYRTMLLTHARRMPLVLPFLGPALYLDGYPVAGWCVAGFSFFGIIILLNKNSIFHAWGLVYLNMNKEIKSVGMVERNVYEKPEIVMVSRNDNYSFTNEWYEIALEDHFWMQWRFLFLKIS